MAGVEDKPLREVVAELRALHTATEPQCICGGGQETHKPGCDGVGQCERLVTIRNALPRLLDALEARPPTFHNIPVRLCPHVKPGEWTYDCPECATRDRAVSAVMAALQQLKNTIVLREEDRAIIGPALKQADAALAQAREAGFEPAK